MRILLIGDPNHVFVAHLAQWLKKSKSGVTVDVLSFSPGIKIKEAYAGFYHQVIPFTGNPLLARLRKIGVLYQLLCLYFILRGLKGKYDVCNVHYIYDQYRFLKNPLKHVAPRLILTIWGSDYYQERHTTRLRALYKVAGCISFTNGEVRQLFLQQYPDIPHAKLYECRFGLEPLEYLSGLKPETVDAVARRYRIDRDKIKITIGYNAREHQQHLQIIDSITMCRELSGLKDKIRFIFPLTYPRDPAYIALLKSRLEGWDYEYRLVTDFLTEEEVAGLRELSDIMIQLQRTDQFSGSMQEYMWTGNIIITGDWLPYQSLLEKGAVMHRIPDVQRAGGELFRIVQDFSREKAFTVVNRSIVETFSCWGKNIPGWYAMYEGEANER